MPSEPSVGMAPAESSTARLLPGVATHLYASAAARTALCGRVNPSLLTVVRSKVDCASCLRLLARKDPK